MQVALYRLIESEVAAEFVDADYRAYRPKSVSIELLSCFGGVRSASILLYQWSCASGRVDDGSYGAVTPCGLGLRCPSGGCWRRSGR